MKNCKYCKVAFEGRSNQEYCSSRCRSAFNNRVVAERTEFIRAGEKALRKNRRILDLLYKLFRSHELPIYALSNAGYDNKAYSALTKDQSFVVYEYCVIIVKTDYFKITKHQ